jgi:error-prone DNA polymerase
VLARTLGVPLFQEQLLKIAMVVANFSGGEAEDLRRAMGFKRSQARMKEIEAKLRSGMTQNGISPLAQEQIILSITSFALYGFPESHAASFALIAYASAYLKCHYLAAFTAAILNNQLMGFYRPATLVKDAQRHGLKMLPIDVTKSDWNCTVEEEEEEEVSTFGFEVSNEPPVTNPVVNKGVLDWSSINKDAYRNPSSSKGNQNPPLHKNKDVLLSSQGRRIWRGSPDNPSDACTRNSKLVVRLGLRYARGVHEEAAQALVRQRNLAPFTSMRDLVQRVLELRKDELVTLAEIGALNEIGNSPQRHSTPEKNQTQEHLLKISGMTSFDRSGKQSRDSSVPLCLSGDSPLHRRDALWQIERAVRRSGPLLDELPEPDAKSPLRPMNQEERLVADFRGTGMTVGPHPMAYHRAEMSARGVRRASELAGLPDGQYLRIGGCVIARQRPGTAKGFVFLSLEDETGVANAIVHPDLFQKNRLLLSSEQFLMVEGTLQNQDNVISIKARRVAALSITRAQTESHDFH